MEKWKQIRILLAVFMTGFVMTACNQENSSVPDMEEETTETVQETTEETRGQERS